MVSNSGMMLSAHDGSSPGTSRPTSLSSSATSSTSLGAAVIEMT